MSGLTFRSPSEIYNSLFYTLPFDAIEKSSLYLPYFQIIAKRDLKRKIPLEIVDEFLNYTFKINETDRHDLLFAFIQFIEHPFVLFDAIEDAICRGK